MTPFLPLRSSRERGRSRRAFYLLAALVLVVFGGTLIMRLLGGVALAIGTPLWQAREVTANVWTNVTAIFADKAALIHERDTLRAQTNLLSAKLADYEQLIKDNGELRARLGRPGSPITALTARVLTGWPSGPFDILTLDLGRDNSQPVIQSGASVLATSGGVWLGRVAAVYGRTSKVQLLSLAGNDLPALLGPNRVPVVLHGRGGGNFTALVPRGVAVTAGDVALASGTERDWLVAVVGAVETTVNQTNDTVYLRQPLNARELEYVVIQ